MSSVPLLVTGLPRSGTSWTGKMLEASGQVVYVNEPLNPRRPPGRSPGVLNASVTHRFQKIRRSFEFRCDCRLVNSRRSGPKTSS